MGGRVLFFKSSIKGYTRADGTYVAPHSDKRQKKVGAYQSAALAAVEKVKSAMHAPVQSSLFGDDPGAPPKPGHAVKPKTAPKPAPASKAKPQPKVFHPKPDHKGGKVPLYAPSKPTALSAWDDPDQVATVVPGGAMPAELNGIPFAPWEDAPTDLSGWVDVDGQDYDVWLDEPVPPELPKGKGRGAGVVVQEADGRVWIVHPSNKFGGYSATFPKGGDEGIGLQAGAIKEAYEESGLKVEILGYLGDVERTTSVARYYLARRVGGTPSDMGWESQAVSLVPLDKLDQVLNSDVDRKLLDMLKKHQS